MNFLPVLTEAQRDRLARTFGCDSRPQLRDVEILNALAVDNSLLMRNEKVRWLYEGFLQQCELEERTPAQYEFLITMYEHPSLYQEHPRFDTVRRMKNSILIYDSEILDCVSGYRGYKITEIQPSVAGYWVKWVGKSTLPAFQAHALHHRYVSFALLYEYLEMQKRFRPVHA